jgi:DNA-binding beta-propeller fold protein YncE
MRISRLGRITLLVVAVLLVAGCAETRYTLRFDQTAGDRVWPLPPDVPRFRYVGELTGEDNLKSLHSGGAGEAITGFFKSLVGLGQDSRRRRRMLLRPQTGVVDASGRIIVTDVGRQAIFVFDEKQGRLQVWRAAAEDYNFVSPVGIAIAKNGDILVSDAELRRVIRLSADGKPRGELGYGDLERPTGLAVDPLSGRIYVADTGENNVKIFAADGTLQQIVGQIGVGPGEFNSPTHLAFSGGRLFVTDTFNARVQAFDAKGNFVTNFGRRGLYLGNLVRPKGVAVDRHGNVYIIESFHDHMLIYNRDARFLLAIGGTGSGMGQFYLPAGVWSDQRDRIYVADMFNGRVMVFQYLGNKSE